MLDKQKSLVIKEISELIVKKRIELGISRLALACETSIDEKQIRRIEKGESKLPILTLLKLFKVLKIDVAILEKYLNDENLLCF